MNPKSLIVLLVLVAALGGLAYFVGQGDEDPTNEFRAGTILSLLGTEPEVIRMRNASGSKSYVLERGKRGWKLTDPVEDEAQQSQIRMLLGQLAQAERKIGWPDGEITPKRLEEAGLVEPSGKLELEAGDKSVVVEFGAECTLPFAHSFARINGEVCRIPTGIEKIVEINRDDLIQQMLFLSQGPRVERLQIERRTDDGGTDGIALRRGANGQFFVRGLRDGADEFPADPDKVARLLIDLLSARVRRFVPRRTLAPGTPVPKPWMTITVDAQAGREVATLSDPAEGTVAALKSYPEDGTERPSRMLVDAQTFEQLVAQPVDSLIATKLWTYGPTAASGFRIERRADKDASKVPQPIVLGRGDDGDFRLVSPSSNRVDRAVLNRLVRALEDIRLVRSISREDARVQKALAVPRYRVSLEPPRDNAALGKLDVRIGVLEDGRPVAQRPDDTLAWVVRIPDLEALDLPWWKYVEPVAFRLGGSSRPVTAIRIERGDRRIDWSPGARGWERDGKLDEDFEEAIYEPLRLLKSKEVAGARPAEFLAGLAPVATIRWIAKPNEREVVLKTLRLYAEGEEGLLSWLDGDLVVHRLFKRNARAMRAFFQKLR